MRSVYNFLNFYAICCEKYAFIYWGNLTKNRMNVFKLLLFILVCLPALKWVMFKTVLLLCSVFLFWTVCFHYGVSWTFGLCICFYVFITATLLNVVFYIFDRNDENRCYNIRSWLWTASTIYIRIFCWICRQTNFTNWSTVKNEYSNSNCWHLTLIFIKTYYRIKGE